MSNRNWAYIALALMFLAGVLWANRDKCVLCDGSIWSLPKKEVSENVG